MTWRCCRGYDCQNLRWVGRIGWPKDGRIVARWIPRRHIRFCAMSQRLQQYLKADMDCSSEWYSSYSSTSSIHCRACRTPPQNRTTNPSKSQGASSNSRKDVAVHGDLLKISHRAYQWCWTRECMAKRRTMRPRGSLSHGHLMIGIVENVSREELTVSISKSGSVSQGRKQCEPKSQNVRV